MVEAGGTPFEDAPFKRPSPPSEPAPSSTPAGDPAPGSRPATGLASSSRPAAGPAPGSPEEAAIILRALSEGSVSRDTLPLRTGAIVASVVIVIAAIVGLIVGADYLRHDVASATTQAGSGGGGGAALTPADVNLKSALTAATSYEAAHGRSLQGLTAALSRAEPSLVFSSVSGTASNVAVGTSVPGSFVMTTFQASPAACVGVLQVVSDEPAAIFSSYPATSRPGTYFFEAPAPAGLCDALTVTPPPGSYLSTTGFPTAALP